MVSYMDISMFRDMLVIHDYVNDKSMQTFEIDVYNKTVKK